MHAIDRHELLRICSILLDAFDAHHPRVPYRIVPDSRAMGEMMSLELIDLVADHNAHGRPTRAIVPFRGKGNRC